MGSSAIVCAVEICIRKRAIGSIRRNYPIAIIHVLIVRKAIDEAVAVRYVPNSVTVAIALRLGEAVDTIDLAWHRESTTTVIT